MAKVRFIFVEELNDFLPAWRKNKPYEGEFEGNPSIKHMVEAIGIPHTEVGRVIVNGEQDQLTNLVKDGDVVEVFPTMNDKENSLTSELQPRFILDNHLGRLAVYLRMLGFDTLYRNDYQDEELAEVASRDVRTLLTRDRRLLMRKVITSGYWVRSKNPPEQIAEILRKYHLAGEITPFQRCLRCNALLQPVDKNVILDRLEPLTRQHFDEFSICPSCGQIYWKGSHYEHMMRFIEDLSAL